jgi:hypothetical protein
MSLNVNPYIPSLTSVQLAFADLIVYIICVFLIKLSICLFIRRLLGDTNPIISRVVFGLICFFIFICLLSFFLLFFACSPISAGWDILLRISRPYKCMDMVKLIRGLNVVYAVGDFILVGLPIYVVCKLKLTLTRKIGIGLVLALGGFTCAISIARLFYVQDAYRTFDPTCKLFFPIMCMI